MDQLVNTGDPEAARQLYRRIATLDLQARKMKFLFKKWLVSRGWRLAGYHHVPSAGFRERAREGGRGGGGALIYLRKSLCNKSVSSKLQTETNANLSEANKTADVSGR